VRPPSDRGIALVASVFVLVVVAALVAGLFFAALQEFRIGQNNVQAERAFDAAEAGLDATLARWDAARLNRLATNETAGFSGSLPGGTGDYTGIVQRLNAQLFLIKSTGQDGSGASQRTLGVLARASPFPLAVAAALAASGQVTIGASGLVDGVDRTPEGWSCPTPRDTVAGVLLGDIRRLSLVGCAAEGCIRGNPGVREDAALGSPMPVLGETGWSDLASQAETVLSSGSAPRPAPVAASPVVYVAGDLELAGGHGQGILLVAGNLVVDGDASLDGIVAVRGTLTMRGAGGRIIGAALVGGAEVGGGADRGQSLVAYSGCAVRLALAAAGPARALRQRAWAELFR
jgi:hypothetical protein